MQKQVFSIDLTDSKESILRKANTLKGLYGVLNLKKGNRLFKFVSAREHKSDPEKVSLSFLVQNNADNFAENKWQMIRVHQKRNGKIELGPYPLAVESFLSEK